MGLCDEVGREVVAAIMVSKDMIERGNRGEDRLVFAKRFERVADAKIGDTLDDSEKSVAYSKVSSILGTATGSDCLVDTTVEDTVETGGGVGMIGCSGDGILLLVVLRATGRGRVGFCVVFGWSTGLEGVDEGPVEGVQRSFLCVAVNSCSFSSFKALTVASRCFLSSSNSCTFASKSDNN